ncbi:MAG: hypothetical protein JJ872_10665 [Marivivens sp.]|nr:hypothetical protein [Marivivens sp.]
MADLLCEQMWGGAAVTPVTVPMERLCHRRIANVTRVCDFAYQTGDAVLSGAPWDISPLALAELSVQRFWRNAP